MPLTNDFFGDQSNVLRWDSVNKQLQVKVTQALSTFRDLTVKYRANLNTATGQHRHTCEIGRPFGTSEPFVQDFLPLARYYERKVASKEAGPRGEQESDLLETEELADNVQRFLPGGFRGLFLEDYQITPAVTLSSVGDEKLRYTVKLRKLPQYMKHFYRTDTTLEWKARADIEPNSKQVALRVSPRMTLFRYNVTQSQNLKATVGLDLTSDFSSSPRKDLYLSVGDQRWDVKLKRNRWQFSYTLA